jgi:Flp pilus assembly protein TadG
MEAVMWEVLARARNRFALDQSGNVAILFALTAVPLVALMGGGVDVTRHHRHKTEILNAMDAAALALVKRGAKTDAEADAFVNSYIDTMLPKDRREAMLHLPAFDATRIEGGYRVAVAGSMDTAFLPVIGLRHMPLALETEVVTAKMNFEVALALDNTGSMAQRNKIGALRKAANKLLDTLYKDPGALRRVETALVPFVTGVNIRGEAFDSSWIDRTGTAPHAMDIFDRPVDRVALAERVVPREGWKGCVEARTGNADLDDTPPTDAATRWLPWFWPDERDGRNGNDYVNDQSNGSTLERLRNTAKYDRPILSARYRNYDEDDGEGPNRSCAGPIVELTRDVGRMRDAIGEMKPNPGSGTNIAQGMVWAWRVLSPDAPFDQGARYEDSGTQKALVLLSDGRNEIGDDYTSYGYLDSGRLGQGWQGAIGQMNRNITTVCEAVKAKRIRVYMILLQVNDRETQRIFEDCASDNDEGEKLYYYAPDNRTLEEAFQSIGEDLTTIRIAR